jgi:hypothetical protein
MALTISCDGFTGFCLLYIGVLFVVLVLWPRGEGRSPTGVVDRGIDRLPGRPDRIANRVLGRLTETGPRCGRTGARESDIPGLEGYPRQFEEAIERIRLSHQGFRWRNDRFLQPRPHS